MGYKAISAGILFALPLLAQSFSIDQVLSAPFPNDLTASPAGDAVAWVFDTTGVRNIWVMREPDFEAHAPITKFTEDDGQEIGDLAWASGGAAIVFTRGGSPNGRGEYPNPTSNPAGVREEIWIVPTTSGSPHRLGDGHSPAVAPDGRTVAWIYAGQVWSAPLDGSVKPAQLIHARGSASELNWSPDGALLAFVSHRGDHDLVGVYDVRGKSLHWLDPSVDSDQSPVWSPDGKQIAFIRSPAWLNETGWGQAPRPAGEPWSIRIAEARTGSGRELWRAQKGPGSVFWPVEAAHQLLWTGTGKIVFPWERDGWLHLYSLPLEGKSGPVLLTPGDFEVAAVAPAPDSPLLFFSSNQDDPERLHIWHVSVDGGKPAIGAGGGIESEPTPLRGGALAMVEADATMPSRVRVLRNGVFQETGIPADFPVASLVDPEWVWFNSGDGLQIHAQLFHPRGAGKHPAVIFFHGGPRRQMLLGWHPMQYYYQAYGFNQYLASEGYVVLSVNYRSGTGHGTAFREPLHYGATGGIEFNDALAAAHYLQSRADVDSTRIGAWGGSYGGYMTALGLARASNLFAAGVDLHGIHDWNLEFPDARPPRSAEVMKLAFESSPLASIDSWRSPVLLIQGDDDRNVAFSQTVRLAEALRNHDVPFEQLILPDEIHDFLLHSSWLKAYHAADDFLARYLKPPERRTP